MSGEDEASDASGRDGELGDTGAEDVMDDGYGEHAEEHDDRQGDEDEGVVIAGRRSVRRRWRRRVEGWQERGDVRSEGGGGVAGDYDRIGIVGGGTHGKESCRRGRRMANGDFVAT